MQVSGYLLFGHKKIGSVERFPDAGYIRYPGPDTHVFGGKGWT